MTDTDATPDDTESTPAPGDRADLNEFLSDAQDTELLELSRRDRSYAEALRGMARERLASAAASDPSEARTPIEFVYLTAAAQALDARATARDADATEVVAAEVRGLVDASRVLSRAVRAALAGEGVQLNDHRELLSRAVSVVDRADCAVRGGSYSAIRPDACYVAEVVDRARRALHSTIVEREGAGLTASSLDAYDDLDELLRRIAVAGGPGGTRRPVEPGAVSATHQALARLVAAVDAAQVRFRSIRKLDSRLDRVMVEVAEARTSAKFSTSEELAARLLTDLLEALAPLKVRHLPLSDWTPALTSARRAAETALATGPYLADNQDYSRGNFLVGAEPTRAETRQRYLAVLDRAGRVWALVPYDDALPTDHRDAVRDARCIAACLSEVEYHDCVFVVPRQELKGEVTPEIRAYVHAELDRALDIVAAEEAGK